MEERLRRKGGRGEEKRSRVEGERRRSGGGDNSRLTGFTLYNYKCQFPVRHFRGRK